MGKILHLKNRRDFIRAAAGIRMVVSSVILQAAPNLSGVNMPFRVGFTTTKKIGNAVVRTRVRRRLRAAVREIFPKFAKDNVDYVLIGRSTTVCCAYETLKADLKWALKKTNLMIENGVYKSVPVEERSKKENHD